MEIPVEISQGVNKQTDVNSKHMNLPIFGGMWRAQVLVEKVLMNQYSQGVITPWYSLDHDMEYIL